MVWNQKNVSTRMKRFHENNDNIENKKKSFKNLWGGYSQSQFDFPFSNCPSPSVTGIWLCKSSVQYNIADSLTTLSKYPFHFSISGTYSAKAKDEVCNPYHCIQFHGNANVQLLHDGNEWITLTPSTHNENITRFPKYIFLVWLASKTRINPKAT